MLMITKDAQLTPCPEFGVDALKDRIPRHSRWQLTASLPFSSESHGSGSFMSLVDISRTGLRVKLDEGASLSSIYRGGAVELMPVGDVDVDFVRKDNGMAAFEFQTQLTGEEFASILLYYSQLNGEARQIKNDDDLKFGNKRNPKKMHGRDLVVLGTIATASLWMMVLNTAMALGS